MTTIARLLSASASRTPRPRLLLATALTSMLAAGAILAGSAQAVVTTVKGVNVGVQPRDMTNLHYATLEIEVPGEKFFAEGPEFEEELHFNALPETYENPKGNPVLHGTNVYAIYWDPTFHYHNDWKSVIDTFLGSLSKEDNAYGTVFSSDTQYTDRSNTPAYDRTTFRGAYTDTTPYPASGCVDPAPLKPWAPFKTKPIGCLTAVQIEQELSSFIATHELPTGMNTVYYIMTPPGVTACLDEGGPLGHCSTFAATEAEHYERVFKSTSYANSFCSYHADINPDAVESGDAKTIVYGVIPWTAGGIDDGQFSTHDQTQAAYCQDGGYNAGSHPPEEYESFTFLTKPEVKAFEEIEKEEKKEDLIWLREQHGPHVEEPNNPPCPTPDGYCDTGLADLIVNQLASEHQNMTTNPLLNSWQDAGGNENTDECRNYFASVIGGTGTANSETHVGNLFNQAYGTQHYYLNDSFDRAGTLLNYPAVLCIPGIRLEPKFTAPDVVEAGDKVSFDSGESNVTLDANTTYTKAGAPQPNYATATWKFGDGSPEVSGYAPGSPPCEAPWLNPCAESVYHSYQYGGTYEVTLKITDVAGHTATTTQSVVVMGPPPPGPEPASGGSGGSSSSSSSSGGSGANPNSVAGGGSTTPEAPVPAPVVTQAVVSHSLKHVLSKGLAVRYSVNEQVAGRFEVLLAQKTAKRLKIRGPLAANMPAGGEKQVVIGTALVVTLRGGKGTAHIVLSKGAAKRLGKVKKLPLNVRLTVHNSALHNPLTAVAVSAFTLGR